MPSFRAGDLVVYQMEKHSVHPGPRARDVRPAPRGEKYSYVVDKYWVVESVEDEMLRLRTPGGKIHRVSPGDPRLRRARLGERIWLRLWDRDRLAALRGPDTAS